MYNHKNYIVTNRKKMRPRKLTMCLSSLMFIQTASLHADSLPTSEIKTNYVSPLEKSIKLQNELLSVTTESSLEKASASANEKASSCFSGTVNFNSKNFSNGCTFKPYPAITITCGKLDGQIKATGKYCYGGTWQASGVGDLKAKADVTVGLNTSDWRYIHNSNYRFKVNFGLNVEGSITGSGSLSINGSNWNWTSASLSTSLQGDLTAKINSPEVTVEQKRFNASTFQYYWHPLSIKSVTNGSFVDNVAFEASAYGKLTVKNNYSWYTMDHDADYKSDKEQQSAKTTWEGKAGLKGKLKVKGYVDVDLEYYWSRASNKAFLDSSVIESPVDDLTDTEVTRRPIP